MTSRLALGAGRHGCRSGGPGEPSETTAEASVAPTADSDPGELPGGARADHDRGIYGHGEPRAEDVVRRARRENPCWPGHDGRQRHRGTRLAPARVAGALVATPQTF